MNVEVVLRYVRYTKEEIDSMSELDAFRRYYVAQKMLEAMSGGGGGGGEYGSYAPDRPPPQRRSRRSSPQSSQSAEAYSFPGG